MAAEPLTLFRTPPWFDGKTYDPMQDGDRLGKQMAAVKSYMLTHDWVTVEELRAAGIHGSETGIAARIRDLRKERFGSYDVDRMRVDGGLYAYRVRR